MLKEEHKLPVDVRGSKTSVLKLSIINLSITPKQLTSRDFYLSSDKAIRGRFHLAHPSVNLGH